MRICFDLDNTLCTGKPYRTASAFPGVKEMLQRLKDDGHIIIIYTARGMGTAGSNPGVSIRNIGRLTLNQLEDWGFIYDEIHFGKPNADVYVDDKAYNANGMEHLEDFILKIKKLDNTVSTYTTKIQSMISKIDKCTKG
jgi:hypothetical protein